MTPQEAMQKYEEAKLDMRKLESVIKELQPIILSHIPEDVNVTTDRGYFYVQKKASWKYSDAVKKAEEEIDKMKEEEVARGDARAEYKNILYYREGAPKEYGAEGRG